MATTPARLEFSYTNPVLGLRWEPGARSGSCTPAWRAAHESPTLGEMAYRPVGGSNGMNFDLKRAEEPPVRGSVRSWRAVRASTSGPVALFDIAHRADEIGVATNAGGRSTFQNVGRTLRRGLPKWAAAAQPGVAAGSCARGLHLAGCDATATPSSPASRIPCNLTTGAGTACR
jgi:iron complex outermembrane receptor protein